MDSAFRMTNPLVDKFGRIHKYLRISLTDKCNLACNYCMPPTGEHSSSSSYMSAGEIARIAQVMVSRCGINKIRLTGGEPTIRSDFPDILRTIGRLQVKKLAITTNGVLLHRYWDDLINANVRYINISLDTLEREKFPLISNKSEKHWDRTWEAIEHAVDLHKRGFIDSLKVNTVVMRHHNDDELENLVDRLTKTWPVQLRFIELMPFSGNNFSKKLLMSKKEILQRLQTSRNIQRIPSTETDQSASVGSDLFQVPGSIGTVGVISSMTDNFCGACDRLRLTADGQIRNCLFSSRESELDLLTLVREGGSDDEIEAVIRKSIGMKAARHGGKSSIDDIVRNTLDSRPMVSIAKHIHMPSAAAADPRAGHLVSRLSALERENVELQEEILSLKKQIMSMKTAGHSRPSTPVNREAISVEGLHDTIENLKMQVTRAVAELRKYRLKAKEADLSPGASVDPMWSVITVDSKSVRSNLQASVDIPKNVENAVDEFDLLLDAEFSHPSVSSTGNIIKPTDGTGKAREYQVNPTNRQITGKEQPQSKPPVKTGPSSNPDVDSFFDDLLS